MVKGKLNLLISGGTGSGKTTLLNVLSAHIPNDERIITIEDAAEVVSKLRADGAAADEIAASRQMMSLLERLVNSLPRDLREALVLSTTEELTSAEISQVLGIPEGSVRNRLLRGRKILRQKLAALLEHKHAR